MIKVKRSRRAVLRNGSIASVLSQIPLLWAKPVVQSVILPAHADTTDSRMATATSGFSTGAALVFDNDNAILPQNPLPTPSPSPLSVFIPAIASIGSYLEQQLTATTVCSLDRIDLSFFIDDQTDNSNISCAQGQTHTFDVIINGTTVGGLSFSTPSTGPAVPPTPPRSEVINVSQSISFAPLPGTGGSNDDYLIRVQATSSVCNAMGNGGNYRFIDSPSGTVDLFGETVCL